MKILRDALVVIGEALNVGGLVLVVVVVARAFVQWLSQ